MCPNEKILNSYIDGVLSKEWTSVVEEHLEVCPKCSMMIKRINESKCYYNDDFPADEQEIQQRVWARINLASEAGRSGGWIQSKISLPAPLVFAMAAVMLFLSFGLLITATNNKGIQTIESIPMQTLNQSIDTQERNLEDIMNYLYSSDAVMEVKITLPTGPQFDMIGEPELLRAAEFKAPQKYK